MTTPTLPSELNDGFYNKVKKSLFGNRDLKPDVAYGCQRIYSACISEGVMDIRDIAYCLATCYHETTYPNRITHVWEPTMSPQKEIGKGKGRAYGKPAGKYGNIYYGRGDVQLTWERNYIRFTSLLGIDIHKNPDLCLDPAVSARILVIGCRDGEFCGRKNGTRIKLSDYHLSDGSVNFVGMRRIINGIDKAELIATRARHFLEGLECLV